MSTGLKVSYLAQKYENFKGASSLPLRPPLWYSQHLPPEKPSCIHETQFLYENGGSAKCVVKPLPLKTSGGFQGV